MLSRCKYIDFTHRISLDVCINVSLRWKILCQGRSVSARIESWIAKQLTGITTDINRVFLLVYPYPVDAHDSWEN